MQICLRSEHDYGLGSRVQGLGSRDHGSGFEADGRGCRVWSAGRLHLPGPQKYVKEWPVRL